VRWSCVGGGLLPVPSGGCAVGHAEQRAGAKAGAELKPQLEVRPAAAIHADLAAAAAPFRAGQKRSAGAVEIGPGEVKRLAGPQAGAPQDPDQRPEPGTVWPVASCTHDGDDLLDRRPEGPGSVSGAPNLPAGFTDTFTSRYIDTGGLRQHAVIGGDGPPLRLVHGWPQNWYAWRLVMPALAREFEVIAPDQRAGIGLSDKPQDARYDPRHLANDLVELLDALGQQRFALVGTDTGLPIGYALAADHPDRVERAVLAEVPGPRARFPHRPSSPRAAQQRALTHRRQPGRRGERTAR
jgi:hypothetical protein